MKVSTKIDGVLTQSYRAGSQISDALALKAREMAILAE